MNNHKWRDTAVEEAESSQYEGANFGCLGWFALVTVGGLLAFWLFTLIR